MATRVIDDSKLQNIAVAIQNKDGGGTMTVDEMPTRIEQNLQSKAVLDSVIARTATIIESDTTSVGTYAFYENRKVETIKLNSALSCGSYAFRTCTNLRNIEMDNLNSFTGGYAFQQCTSLTEVNLPKLQEIKQYLFVSCTSLIRAMFMSATYFYTAPFQSCTSFATLILGKKASLINGYVFDDNPNCIIYVKPEDLSWYSTATNWSTLYAQDRIKSIEDLTGDDLAWYQEQLARYQAQTA